MPRADDPFAFKSGTLTIGSDEHLVEIPARLVESDFKPALTFTRGDQWPARVGAGRLVFEGTLTGVLDPLGAIRDIRCPGCGTRWVEVEPGHSWSSARGGCWTETRSIDEYGRPMQPASTNGPASGERHSDD